MSAREEAEKALDEFENRFGSAMFGWTRRVCEAFRAWLDETAPPVTEDDREALDIAVSSVLWNASNYPRRAQPGILGGDILPLCDKVTDAVIAAGFRRSQPVTDEWERLRTDNQWPTPNHMRRAATGLDSLAVARYGDVLRYVADLCDGVVPE